MALVVVAKHSRSGESAGPSAAKPLEDLSSSPRARRSGWLAIEGGSDASRKAVGGREASGGSSADSGLAGSGERFRSGRGSGRRGFGAGTGYSGSDPIRAGANIDLDSGVFGDLGQRRGGGLGQTHTSGTGTQEVVKKTDNSTDTTQDDPNAPVLSLPFDKTTQPDKGEGPLVDQNVSCGEDGEGCLFNADSQFAIPDAGNLSGEAGSISFCLQPQWGGTDPSNASLVTLHSNTWENRFSVFKNGSDLRFLLWPNSGIETGVGARIDNWQPGTWHPVTATYGPDPNTGVNMVSLYVDGTLIGQSPYDSSVNLPQSPLYIGSDSPAGSPAALSALKDFQVYNRVLGAGEAVDFAAGCSQ